MATGLFFQFNKTVVGYTVGKKMYQMFADIFLVVMLETSETSRMKQNKNNHYFSIIHAVRFVPMLMSCIFDHMFFLLQRKFLAEIICHTINLCNFRLEEHSDKALNIIIEHYKFNTFIAIFLLFRQIVVIVISKPLYY
jgi:hypothetical protein